jgi:hypothetical protein
VEAQLYIWRNYFIIGKGKNDYWKREHEISVEIISLVTLPFNTASVRDLCLYIKGTGLHYLS